MTPTRRVVALLSTLVLVPVVAVTTAATTTAATTTAAATTAGTPATSAADGSLFRPLSGYHPGGSANVSIRPTRFRAYRADLAGLRARLAGGPTTLSIPDPAGTATSFSVAEDSVMAPSLQARHPDIRTYAGSAANGTTIRLDVTPLGFHAMVRRPDGVAWYVEPATRAVGENRVLSFAGAAAGDAPTFVEQEVAGAARQAAESVGTDYSTPGGLVTQRTYRLALVTDPAYAAAFTAAVDHATADPIVLAAKTTLVNRVDEVYNDDVAYRFTMIPGTDTKLNLLTAAEMSGPDGPCGASACYPDATGAYDCSSVLDRNPWALGQLVGADSFDIGHIGLGVDGGGIAGLGVVGTADKAVGCTGIPTPVGDVYAIDYVAHEMGHQMGGNHTFNGTQSNCSGGNRNGATSVEPGSGTSIMAYAGICSSDNLQPHSDPYFSFTSIDEFEATTAAAPGNNQEEQVVNLKDFGGTDAFTISCSGCPNGANTVTNGTTYNLAGLTTALLAATGEAAVVAPYDSDLAITSSGFTVTWPTTGDKPKLVITPASGSFTTFTGTIVNGGPATNGGTQTVTADHSPVVTAPADKTIPKQTPFTLTGAATDQDGDTLSYLWEQTDNGVGPGTGLVDNTKLNGPLFRVFGTYANVTDASTVLYHSPGENLAGTDPSRTFPDLQQILVGNTNARTGTCPAPLAAGTVPVSDPALSCFSEFLPTASWLGTGNRVMHFRLTARDEFSPDGPPDHVGGVAWDDVALTVNPAAGPFLVTSQGTSAPQSGPTAVTWTVAGTNAASMAPNVRISLSTDGGLTYPTVLAASTPNDGSQVVLLPDLTTSAARIKVEAVGNYFFDVNDATFPITGATHVAQGKGRFRSPRGSSTKAENTAGNARFQFLGEAGPHASGSASFRFRKGRIAFVGDRVTTSKIEGHTFITRVTGTSQGRKRYTLVIVAVDEGDKAGRDRIRIRLLRGKKLVYDSMPGRRASAEPRTRIKGQIAVT